MKVFSEVEVARAHVTTPVATIGNFDGLHRGHRAILERVRARAEALGGSSLLITFDPHPLKVLAPDRAPRMITTRRQKLDLLQAAGIDCVLILPFDMELASVTPETFVRRYLGEGLGLREVYVGAGFNFGRDRAGNADTLVQLCAALQMRAAKVEEILYLDSPISSSRIRRAVQSGEVELAGALLGRPFALEGRVVHGDGRGAAIGVPTANLETPNDLVPGDGVYVTEAVLESATHPAVTNIGSRPTFEGAAYAIETHLLEGTGDIYDRPIEVRFLARLRQELKFPSVEALIDQVRRDVVRARDYHQRQRT